MSLSENIQTIRRAAQKVKLTELSRLSKVPYTTLRDWEKSDWRVPRVEAFAQVVEAADQVLSRTD